MFCNEFARTIQGETSGRQCGRNEGMEVVRVDTSFVVAQNKEHWFGGDEMNWRSEQICSQEADGWNFLEKVCRLADDFWPQAQGRGDEFQEQQRRGRAAQSRVERGQVSRAGQELTGAALAPKNSEKSRELPRRRPQDQMSEIPRDVLEFQPPAPFQLDESLFVSCLKSARSGCSPGPGGCTNEMLRVCLDDAEVLHLLFRAGTPSSPEFHILYHGAQLEVDITLRSALSASGLPRFNAAVVDGAVCGRAREDKERKYAKLLHGDRCRLVVVALWRRSRWSQEAVDFVCWVGSCPGAREATPLLRRSAFLGWRRRWSRMVAISCARAFATSLTAVNALPHALAGVDGVSPDLGDLLTEA